MSSIGTSTSMDFELNKRKSSNVVLSETRLKKRPRCNNFSPQEKAVLLSLVDKYRDIVTSKKTDRVALEEKDIAWQNITKEFNGILGYDSQNIGVSEPRSLKNIKGCFENLRKKKNKCNSVIIIKQECIDIDDENWTSSNDNTTLQENSESRTSNCSNFFDINGIASSTSLTTNSSSNSFSAVTPCTVSSIIPSAASADTYAIPCTNSSVIPSTTSFHVESATPCTTDGIFIKKPISKLCSRSNKSKSRNSIEMKLKMRLMRKELELKELELATQSTLSELKIKVQKAKLEFYEKKKEMLNAHCITCESKDMCVDQ